MYGEKFKESLSIGLNSIHREKGKRGCHESAVHFIVGERGCPFERRFLRSKYRGNISGRLHKMFFWKENFRETSAPPGENEDGRVEECELS